MTKAELESKLTDALESFKDNIDDVASDAYGKRPVTEGDLVEFTKQTFYVLSNFKDAILEYLP